MAITVKCVPVEVHHSIGKVERYHALLRRAYKVITGDIPSISKQFALQMAVKAINDTAGPNGLTPTLLVFGTYPRMVDTDPPHPTIVQRAATIKKAMKEVSELYAKRHVAEALRQRNGPYIEDVLDMTVGEKVMVWREEGGWQGPYPLLSIEGYTYHIQLPRGPSAFRITSVKKYQEDLDTSSPASEADFQPPPRDTAPEIPL